MTVHIAEFNAMGAAGFLGGPSAAAVQCPQVPPIATHQLEAGDVIVFDRRTCFIRLVSDEDCMVDMGPAADARVGGLYVVARTVEFFGVRDGHCLAVADLEYAPVAVPALEALS